MGLLLAGSSGFERVRVGSSGFERHQLHLLLPAFKTGYFNYVVYFYIFTATSNLFLPIFMYISTYFHVCLYLYLTYLDIFSCIFIPIFMYISTYFYIFTTKVWHFATDCHKSVLFYYRLPQKCGILLQFTDIYHISVVFTQ